MELNKETIACLREPIDTVWNSIAPDACELVDDNEGAIEMCIDADRLSSIANDKEAQAVFSGLVREHGYSAVLKFLSLNIVLI